MTLTRGLALFLSVATAGTLVKASGPNATPIASVRLTAISARVNAKGASLVIEASEPVAYTATRPDPLTVLLDFRNVAAGEVANSVAANAKSPIASVSIEATESLGAPASRVRIALAQPVAHRVRSDRNTVVIDFDKPSPNAAPFAMAAPAAKGSGPAPDAMRALENSAAAVDPIAALGLDLPPGGPFAAPSPVNAPLLAPMAIRPAAARQQPQPPLPPPAPTMTTDQVSGTRTGRQFTGHPISLDFQGADLRAVLRTFAEISGLNIVIDPAVTGTVDVALRDVPWDQALDIILAANKLGYLIDGTIVRIAPLMVLADEQTQRRKVSEEQALAGQLEVLTKTLSYARAEDLQALLTKSALSLRGTVQVDQRTNTLIITDLRDRLTLASELITTLDRAQPQVEIEARIVQTNKDYARALGVQWGFNGNANAALGNTTPLAFPNNGALGGRTGGIQGPVGAGGTQPTAVSLAAPAATSAIGLALGSVNGAFGLDVALSALERSGNGRLLSTPRVTTQNNVNAEIAQGVKIPVQTQANNTISTTYVDAALTLKVTPQITAVGTVIMQISVDNGSANPPEADGSRSINTQRATTTVLVGDGQTTVIGGIYVSQEQSTNGRTPVLSRIPLLGWLFKRDTLNDQSTELLIFITPRIIKS